MMVNDFVKGLNDLKTKQLARSRETSLQEEFSRVRVHGIVDKRGQTGGTNLQGRGDVDA
jgi:hypothetical protein